MAHRVTAANRDRRGVRRSRTGLTNVLRHFSLPGNAADDYDAFKDDALSTSTAALRNQVAHTVVPFLQSFQVVFNQFPLLQEYLTEVSQTARDAGTRKEAKQLLRKARQVQKQMQKEENALMNGLERVNNASGVKDKLDAFKQKVNSSSPYFQKLLTNFSVFKNRIVEQQPDNLSLSRKSQAVSNGLTNLISAYELLLGDLEQYVQNGTARDARTNFKLGKNTRSSAYQTPTNRATLPDKNFYKDKPTPVATQLSKFTVPFISTESAMINSMHRDRYLERVAERGDQLIANSSVTLLNLKARYPSLSLEQILKQRKVTASDKLLLNEQGWEYDSDTGTLKMIPQSNAAKTILPNGISALSINIPEPSKIKARNKELKNYYIDPQTLTGQTGRLCNTVYNAAKLLQLNPHFGPISRNSEQIYIGAFVDPLSGQIRLPPKPSQKYMNPISYESVLEYKMMKLMYLWNATVRQWQSTQSMVQMSPSQWASQVRSKVNNLNPTRKYKNILQGYMKRILAYKNIYGIDTSQFETIRKKLKANDPQYTANKFNRDVEAIIQRPQNIQALKAAAQTGSLSAAINLKYALPSTKDKAISSTFKGLTSFQRAVVKPRDLKVAIVAAPTINNVRRAYGQAIVGRKLDQKNMDDDFKRTELYNKIQSSLDYMQKDDNEDDELTIASRINRRGNMLELLAADMNAQMGRAYRTNLVYDKLLKSPSDRKKTASILLKAMKKIARNAEARALMAQYRHFTQIYREYMAAGNLAGLREIQPELDGAQIALQRALRRISADQLAQLSLGSADQQAIVRNMSNRMIAQSLQNILENLEDEDNAGQQASQLLEEPSQRSSDFHMDQQPQANSIRSFWHESQNRGSSSSQGDRNTGFNMPNGALNSRLNQFVPRGRESAFGVGRPALRDNRRQVFASGMEEERVSQQQRQFDELRDLLRGEVRELLLEFNPRNVEPYDRNLLLTAANQDPVAGKRLWSRMLNAFRDDNRERNQILAAYAASPTAEEEIQLDQRYYALRDAINDQLEQILG